MHALRRWLDLGLYVGRRFKADRALDRASSLSYATLLSLVPLLAIALAMLAAFPVFDGVRGQLESLVFHNFVPEVGEQVDRHIAIFVANAGRLTAVGVAGLAVTAITLLVTIESALNGIFRVVTARPPLSRLLVYWTALTLGPLLVGVSFSLSAWLLPLQDWAEHAGLAAWVRLGAAMLPSLLLMLAFALLYLAVPNRRVAVADALTGGIAAGLALALLRLAFGVYIARAHVYRNVYGAMAAVPIFLFWTYLSWAVVLFGAELTAALPEWRRARPDPDGPLSPRRRLTLALTVLALLRADARAAAAGLGRQDLLEGTGEGESALFGVLSALLDGGYLARTAAGRYVLARDLGTARLADLAERLQLGPGPGGGAGLLAERLDQAAAAQAQAFDLPLATVLEDYSSPLRGL
ncbi:ribonuclease BN/unknown domain fusion protein [mine drainage metagenome]|uniref:Uncharacterized protein n=1 Tax=mine drainage metagenome TaxID=410659 RepID=A0A1J5RYB0_9ZZZZ